MDGGQPHPPSQAAPQSPEGAQCDGVESQHHQVALEEQPVNTFQEGQPSDLLLGCLVLGLEVLADGLKLGQDFLQGPGVGLVLLRNRGLCMREENTQSTRDDTSQPGPSDFPLRLMASPFKKGCR